MLPSHCQCDVAGVGARSGMWSNLCFICISILVTISHCRGQRCRGGRKKWNELHNFINAIFCVSIPVTASDCHVHLSHCRGGGKKWNVFYHFVGAIPGSTSLECMLKRLLRELELAKVRSMFCLRLFK